MLRNRAVALIICWLASPIVWGLGLGPLHATSGLNEPFVGRIEILGATAEDFDTLTIGLAGLEHFERAGIARPPILLQLRFAIDDSAGEKNHINISSADPIREPFLNFLLELNWSNGRLLREYTVLLDPPIYDPHRGSITPPPSAAVDAPPEVPASAEVADDVEAVQEAAEAPMDMVIPSGEYVTGRELGPMIATDTLWSIATAARPDESVTVQQMMLALLRANPEAFSDANINMLRRGAILRLPELAELGTESVSEAFAEVKRQNQVWEEYRQQLGLAPTAQPLGAPASGPSPQELTSAPDAEARLELLAPGAEGGDGAPGTAGGGADLLREELDAQSQLNVDLDDKLTEAEKIIDLLQRQVNIKDEELLALQARLAELGIEHGDIGAIDAPLEEPAPVEPEPVATIEPEPEPEIEPEPQIEPESDIALEDDAEVDVTPDLAADEEPVDEPEIVAAEPDGIIEMDTGPPAEPGFPANLIPAHIASMVPGGALTILGVVALVILGLFVGIVQFLLKSRAGRSDAAPAVVAPVVAEPEIEDEDEDATEDPTITSQSEDEVEDDASEAVTAIDEEEFDPDTTKDEFDPDATVDARSDDEPQEDLDSTVAQAGAVAQAAAAPVEEEDPLEEVNVYLAYERFDQAEELVKRVIGEYPDRHEYKLRLLEVYYSSNDKGAYEGSAKELHEAVGDSDALWESAVAMWSEMSPERALFEAGAETDPEEAAPDQDAAKAFVDITGDSDETEAGADTMVMAPGSDADEALDFDLAADDTADDEGILDLTATADDDDGGMLDLTVADTGGDDVAVDISGGDESEGVLDITDGGDEGVLDITEGGADLGDDLLDLTGGDSEGIMDISAMDDANADSMDLLDVTKTGDMTGVEDGDLLNVTSPGLSADDELDVGSDAGDDDDIGLEITESGEEEAADEGIDFDISDTVAPAFDIDADAEAERVLDVTEGGDIDDAGGSTDVEEDDPLEFDIGGLDADDDATDNAELGDLEADEAPTVDLDSALEAVAADDSADAGGDLDFDITMGDEDLTGELDVVEAETDDGGLEITMSTPEDAEIDLDEIAIDDAADLNVEEEDFNFALENTAEKDGIAADDTLDMAQADTGGPGTLDIGDDASLDDLTMELDAAMDDPLADDGDLELDIEAVVDEGDAEHLQTVALEDDALDLIDDHAEKTVVMPRPNDVETQSDADEADTKLNLAKAYIELGDTEGARSILDEVANDGNDAQKAEAKALLDQLS